MNKYLTGSNPSVVELRTMLYEYCLEAIHEGLVDAVLKNTTKFLSDNASEATAEKLTALTYRSMGVVLGRMMHHCGQQVGTWVSNEEGIGYRLEVYCTCCGWGEQYGGK